MQVSVLIPARNEAANLDRCLRALTARLAARDDWEVVVGDHDSIDGTPDIAAAHGAIVLAATGSTVAAVRNRLAESARGAVLIFLDSDTEVSDGWLVMIDDVVIDLLAQNGQITGSICVAPTSDNVFVRCWFSRLERKTGTYLGAAHLIVKKCDFDALCGFNEELASGEDVDLCKRAVQAGGSIRLRPELRVTHHGYPLSIREFYHRERWHGRGDCVSVSSFFSSQVAVASAFLVGLQAAAILSLAFYSNQLYALLQAGVVVSLVVLSLKKFPSLPVSCRISNVGIMLLYVTARTHSLVDQLRSDLHFQRRQGR